MHDACTRHHTQQHTCHLPNGFYQECSVSCCFTLTKKQRNLLIVVVVVGLSLLGKLYPFLLPLIFPKFNYHLTLFVSIALPLPGACDVYTELCVCYSHVPILCLSRFTNPQKRTKKISLLGCCCYTMQLCHL